MGMSIGAAMNVVCKPGINKWPLQRLANRDCAGSITEVLDLENLELYGNRGENIDNYNNNSLNFLYS